MYAYRALLSNRFNLVGLTEGRNCSTIVDNRDDGLLPELPSGENEKIHTEILKNLQSNWPSELRSNILYYMAGWAARQVIIQ